MGYTLVKLICFSVLVLIVVSIIPGITLDTFGAALTFSVVIATLNTLIKPLIDYQGHPFNNAVLGMSAVFINIPLFYLAHLLIYQITVETFLSVFISALLIGVGEMIISSLIDKHKYSK